jgi:hypothetical protein
MKVDAGRFERAKARAQSIVVECSSDRSVRVIELYGTAEARLIWGGPPEQYEEMLKWCPGNDYQIIYSYHPWEVDN